MPYGSYAIWSQLFQRMSCGHNEDILEIQRQSGAKYLEYMTQKIANEKAQHEKDIQLKEI